MARVEATDELDALKAQLADFALRHAAEAIARDPRKFLSSDVMKAVEQAALAAVEARLAREPRPSPEDFAEQVLVHIRPELTAAIQGAAGAAPRGSRARDVPAETGTQGLMRELQRHWATVAVAALIVAAAGGAIGFLAGQGLKRADIAEAAQQRMPDTESTDEVGPAPISPADTGPQPSAPSGPAATPTPGPQTGPTGAAAPKR